MSPGAVRDVEGTSDMTTHKSFKRRIRVRIEKTGESYTAARRQLISRAQRQARETVTAAAPESISDDGAPAISPDSSTRSPSRGGEYPMSDEAVRNATGRGWEEWFALLDGWGATSRTHREIARWLVRDQGVAGWWAQSVTVAYERARGMRRRYERPEGGFGATASKTVEVPVERLFEAFADEGLRARWLPDGSLRIRTATPPKSVRFDGQGATRVSVGFYAKGDHKSQASLAHERLPDADAAERMKAYWRERMAALKEMLEG